MSTQQTTVHTEVNGFERDAETGILYLIFPVPEGKRWKVGTPATITFEGTSEP